MQKNKMTLIALTALLSLGRIARAEEAADASSNATQTTPVKKTIHRKKRNLKTHKKVEETTQSPAVENAAGAPAPAAGEAPKKSISKSLEAWLIKIRKRVESSKAKQNKLVAVAAVRGAEATDPAPLYWKGKDVEKPVDQAEMDEFNAAVETAMSGEPATAKSKLEQFVSNHPKSPLVEDAAHTLDILKQEETQ